MTTPNINQSGVRIWAASMSQHEIQIFNPQAWVTQNLYLIIIDNAKKFNCLKLVIVLFVGQFSILVLISISCAAVTR